jgi:hypothetical protein
MTSCSHQFYLILISVCDPKLGISIKLICDSFQQVVFANVTDGAGA